MSATLDTAPPARALAREPIWIKVVTDLISGTAAYFEITISGAGPSAAETLLLTWPGGSITYTVSATPDGSGLQWPTKGGGETLTDYTNRIGDFLRQREDVGDVFDVTVVDAPGGVLRLSAKVIEEFTLAVTDGMTNVSVTSSPGAAAASEDNLRAYVEVWSDTGDFNTDERLAVLHSPYNIPTAATDLDIGAAFAHLKAHLPDANTITIGISLALDSGVATSAFQRYYLRLADKYGAPAVAEALLKTEDSYIAILGARAGDSLHVVAPDSPELYIRHNYRRRAEAYDHYLADDTTILRIPVTDTQPNWVYVLLYAGAVGVPAADSTADVYVECTLYWSDGTSSVRQPYADDPTPIELDKIYWFPSGYRQMKLQSETPPGADTDAYIVAYDWKLVDEATDVALCSASYAVQYLAGWDYYLMFDNGVGGCETACFRGKASEKYKTTADRYSAPRRPDWTTAEHLEGNYAAEGRREWELNSGWTTDADWLEHLRQLCLAENVWLVDLPNERFLAVTVDTRDIDTRKDDEPLFQLPITVRAAWSDAAANV